MNGSDMLERLATGINGFDQVALGGLTRGRTTLVTGSTGSGKTLFAVEFLARGILRFGEPGVFVTFEERPDDLRRNWASLGFPIRQWESEGKWAFVDASAGWGIDLDSPEESGLLRIVCDYPEVASLEDHFIRIRRAIEEHKPDRLVIDTLSALERIVSPRALLDFVIALGAVVRQHGITTLLTSAPAGRFTPQLTPSIAGEIASLTDVTIVLRYLEHPGEVRRAIAVMQTRGSAHDQSIRQVTIDGGGMHIGEPVADAAGIFSGTTLPPVPGWQAGTPVPENS